MTGSSLISAWSHNLRCQILHNISRCWDIQISPLTIHVTTWSCQTFSSPPSSSLCLSLHIASTISQIASASVTVEKTGNKFFFAQEGSKSTFGTSHYWTTLLKSPHARRSMPSSCGVQANGVVMKMSVAIGNWLLSSLSTEAPVFHPLPPVPCPNPQWVLSGQNHPSGSNTKWQATPICRDIVADPNRLKMTMSGCQGWPYPHDCSQQRWHRARLKSCAS